MKVCSIRILTLFLIFSLFFAVILTPKTLAESPSIPDTSNAEYVFLYNVNTDKMIYSKNAAQRMFPGSAVKIMTGLIICEKFGTQLDEKVTVTQEMIDLSVGGTIKLEEGMIVTVKDLLYGMLCGGGNDATVALAIYCSGSVQQFVNDMNDKAKSLKMNNTYYTNPTGLDDSSMYSTVSDILILAKEAYKNELYIDVSSAMSYVYTPQGTNDEIKIFNRNALISNFYALGYRNLNAYGLISGNTSLGGYCTVTYSEINGTGYLCGAMNAKGDSDEIYSYTIVNSLLDYAFDNYSYVQIAEKNKFICTVNTKFALPENKKDAVVRCVIMNDVFTLTHNDVDLENKLEYRPYFYTEPLAAPVEQGVIVGGVDILYGGEVIGNAFLITEDSVEASNLLIVLDSLKSFFTGRFFILSVCFSIIGLLIYSRLNIVNSRKAKRKSKNVSKRFYQ